MVGNAFRTKETAAVLCDEDIVLNADTAKVLVSLKLIEIDELLAMSAGLPIVDEGRDEVDARFVGKHETFFELAAHTQTVRSKLFKIRTCLFVETYIDLSQSFHVVNVHTHHVSQSVRQEHGVCTSGNGCVGITLH